MDLGFKLQPQIKEAWEFAIQDAIMILIKIVEED